MAMPHSMASPSLISPLKGDRSCVSHLLSWSKAKPASAVTTKGCYRLSSSFPSVTPLSGSSHISSGVVRASNRTFENSKSVGGKRKEEDDGDELTDSDEYEEPKGNDSYLMNAEERREWRSKIREVMDRYPDVEGEMDPEERRKMMQKLLADYPLVVEEDDPNWRDDGDGWGFNLGQFFDKIAIKNKRKDDDEDSDSENEIVWQDDNYIRPIKDIKTAEWEETVFKDISPLIVLVHNRYKRPKENENFRDELEKAVHIIWNCRLPSPRCVAIDAIKEVELVSTLKVSVFPEIIFTKAGKILYREKGPRTADELSKIMAFFYYGAAKPNCLDGVAEINESIPSVST
ncbi:thioredoxin-like fold domain-containing protein MRL7L, chloroplastic isoform X2 [Punica granatum]|uniref:Thioredoxin-like fold domain-containing protein MRL7L, chloroplastic isoform X2 n=1 Tax=Punica granatum TaxID=22663 RepID=A0A6P8DA57_PUNGR|nr:thioredoxin-like fold domain-containing protein MRL7L, chloroplastic isoform X2 [Punica granatum]